MSRSVSDRDFEELRGCIELINLRLSEHQIRGGKPSESTQRAEIEAEKAMQIIRRIESDASTQD